MVPSLNGQVQWFSAFSRVHWIFIRVAGAETGLPQLGMTMKYVALRLRGKTLEDKMSLATSLAGALDTNAADYPDPDPTPQEYKDKVAEIEAKKKDVSIMQTQLNTGMIELAALEDELDGMLTHGGVYIQKASKGVEGKIIKLGIGVRNTPTVATTIGRVMNLRLTATKNVGEVKSAHKPVAGARSYEYQINTDPNNANGWKPFDTSSVTRTVLEGLPSGMRIWIRVRAIGSKRAGKGPWSEAVMVLVP